MKKNANKKQQPTAAAKKAMKARPKSAPKPAITSGLATSVRQATSLMKSLNAKISKVKNTGPFETIGRAGGQFLGSIFGTGDYILNDIVHQRGAAGTLRRGVQSNTVSNCEYVRDIVTNGSSDFAQSVSPIQPTEITLFPWLTNVSKLYTKYRFKQLIFEFRSMSSEYSSQVGLGSIIMAPQYNVDAPLFQTKQQMEAASHAVSFKPSVCAMMGFECAGIDNNVKWFNVRNRAEMEITPLTDPGRFCVALAGVPSSIPAGTTLGELWVHYTIELIEPILASPSTGPSTQFPNVYQYYSIDGGTGLLENSPFAFGSSAAGNTGYGPLDPSPTKWAVATTLTSLTSRTDWMIGWLGPSGSQSLKLYFSTPGLYFIDWFARWNVALTTLSALPYDLNADSGAQAIVNTGLEIAASSRSRNANDRTTTSLRWMVRILSATSKAPAVLTWIPATGNAGGSNATLYSSQVTVFAYPGAN